MSTLKQQMIDIATETAQKGGIQAITIRDLGEAVGIKASSVMYHFRNKDGLLLAISESYARLFFERLAQLDNATPAVRLDGLACLFEDALHKDRMCLCGMLAAESYQLDPATRASTQAFFVRMQDWVSEVLTEAGQAPQLAPLIVSSLEGAMLLDRLENTDARLEAVRHWLMTLTEG